MRSVPLKKGGERRVFDCVCVREKERERERKKVGVNLAKKSV